MGDQGVRTGKPTSSEKKKKRLGTRKENLRGCVPSLQEYHCRDIWNVGEKNGSGAPPERVKERRKRFREKRRRGEDVKRAQGEISSRILLILGKESEAEEYPSKRKEGSDKK